MMLTAQRSGCFIIPAFFYKNREMVSEVQHVILPSVRIPPSELSFTFSCSSGKGGQHVNKVNTRVTLRFDLQGSPSLSVEQKALLRQRLAGRINKQGVLSLVADRRRSQAANREDAITRFCSLLRAALQVNKARKKTKPTRGSKKRRLQAKKQRSQLKKQRGRTHYKDE